MSEKQFKILIRVLGLLLRALVWGSDPAGVLERSMSKIEAEVEQEPSWIKRDWVEQG